MEHHFQTVAREWHVMGSVLSAAQSAIDIALWDIAGKAAGVPVHRLLGGACRERVRVFENIRGDSAAERGDHARELVEAGFVSLRTEPFFGGWELETSSSRVVGSAVEIVGAIRDAIGYDVDLGVEIHRNLTIDEAIMLGRELEKPAADRWQMRISHCIKDTSADGHIIACHDGPRIPPLAQRFRVDPAIVKSIMYQEWSTRKKDDGWLAAGIEDVIGKAFCGWTGSRIFAEWGYERNPTFENKLPHHEFCDRNHTRRSAWGGVTQAMGIINGQENSWGPWMLLEEDLPGTADLVVLKNFLLNDVPLHALEPAPGLVQGSFTFGYKPLALRDKAGEVAVVYYPAGGGAHIDFAAASAQWFDPRTSKYQPAGGANGKYTAPSGKDENKRALDFVLVLRA